MARPIQPSIMLRLLAIGLAGLASACSTYRYARGPIEGQPGPVTCAEGAGIEAATAFFTKNEAWLLKKLGRTPLRPQLAEAHLSSVSSLIAKRAQKLDLDDCRIEVEIDRSLRLY